jgi:hypothetical protein
VGPNLNYGVLLKVLAGFLLRRFFVGGNQIVASKRCAPDVDGVGGKLHVQPDPGQKTASSAPRAP